MDERTTTAESLSPSDFLAWAHERACAVELAHRIRATSPGRYVVMDRLRWHRERVGKWLEGDPGPEGGTRIFTTLPPSAKRAVVLCPVDKLNNLPNCPDFSIQAMLPGCEDLVGIPAIMLNTGKIVLCPLDIHCSLAP